MIIKISIRANTMTTLTISTMITLITLISSNTCGRWRWCHLRRPPPSPTDKIRQIWPFRQNTNWPPKFSAISPVVQWRDVIVAQRQLTQKRFLWTRDLWTTQIIWSVLLFPHRTKQSRAAICPCLAFSAQLDLSFGRLWNLDVEWNRHDCDPATFDLMTWRLWSWSTWNYAPRRFQILNMVWESDVENSAWNRSLGGAWLWGRGLEFEPPPCSGHPAWCCIYHLALQCI